MHAQMSSLVSKMGSNFILKFITRAFPAYLLVFFIQKINQHSGLNLRFPPETQGAVYFFMFLFTRFASNFVYERLVLPFIIGIGWSYICHYIVSATLISHHWNKIKYVHLLSYPIHLKAASFFALFAAGILGFFFLRPFSLFKREFTFKALEDIDRFGNGDIQKGGELFELYVRDLFRKLGCEAHTIAELKRAGKVNTVSFDQGADVLIEFFENGIKKKGVIQCKHYKNSVGNKAVQEVHAAKSFYQTDYAYVITNNYFTSSAKELANANSTNVTLFDRDELARLIDTAKNPNLSYVAQNIKAKAA